MMRKFYPIVIFKKFCLWLLLLSLLFSSASADEATQQKVFNEGTAYGMSQVDSAMDAIKDLNTSSLKSASPSQAASAEETLEQSINTPNATVDEAIIDAGEETESGAEKTVTDNEIFCSTGDCKNTETTSSDDFDEGGSELSAVSTAGEDVKENPKNDLNIKNPEVAANLKVTSFGGGSTECRYDSASFKNCCSQSGTGIDIGFGCSNSEKELAKATAEHRTIYVGTYCSKDEFLIGCIEHKKVYCKFTSLLSRIIQTDGRSRQLHISFGTINDDNHSANCRGLYPDEVEEVNFDQCDAKHPKPNCIDYTEYYAELESQVTAPTS